MKYSQAFYKTLQQIKTNDPGVHETKGKTPRS